MLNRSLMLLLCALSVLTAPRAVSAQTAGVDRTWLFGAGHSALYDEYLSPLDYTGPEFSVGMQNERTPRWAKAPVSQLTQFEFCGTYASNPGGNAHFYDGQVNVGFGWFYHFAHEANRPWNLALGGLAEFSGGGTYSTRNGNNPAQGRAAFDVAPSAIFTYAFRAPRCFRISGHWCGGADHSAEPMRSVEPMCYLRVQLDVPLAGLMFSPQYGQSYFELFELGHYDHNVCFTYPGNAPSARLQATLHVPVSRTTRLVVGYRGEALQSHVNHLGRHAWQNGAVIGFTRNLKF